MHKVAAVALIFAMLTACAPVDNANTEEAAEAETFQVSEDLSRIYVYRDDNVVLNTRISVSIDGELVGVTGNKTYVVATVDPGTHTIVAKGENTDELTVETVSGEIVFVELGVGLGAFTNRANLFQVESEDGKAAVLQTRLVR
ncbi:MAG: DUF2846 domain-containing protein [Pseudomonadota bacterium]